jgi:DnaK suppressor protein
MENLTIEKINNDLFLKNHYLTLNEISQIKDKLIEEEKILRLETINVLKSIKNEHSDKGDLIDRANKEYELEIESKIVERDNISLNSIDFALYRINNDSNFGYCTFCEEPIGFKRLMVRPVSRDCIDCKSLKELDEMYLKLRTKK